MLYTGEKLETNLSNSDFNMLRYLKNVFKR